jgi:hypothetical protein
MIGQYLPNNNETVTVAFRQKFCQLNSPLSNLQENGIIYLSQTPPSIHLATQPNANTANRIIFAQFPVSIRALFVYTLIRLSINIIMVVTSVKLVNFIPNSPDTCGLDGLNEALLSTHRFGGLRPYYIFCLSHPPLLPFITPNILWG